ncbi:MAG: hypothetical protein PHU12_02955 [Candidatus Aenigmarchaeota archaeon]|nr:hypothetical protein [Candidatus Aenigmarchaeota archaeon]
MSELAEDFMKMIHISVIVIGILAIFFVFIQYNIILHYSYSKKEVLTFGDSLLASKCLAVETDLGTLKAVFDEEKLNSDNLAECIKYNEGVIKIYKKQETEPNWTIELGSTDKGSDANFNIGIKQADGTIIPGEMVVSI